MNEKPKFLDPGDLPKRLSPELEEYKKKIFLENPEAIETKDSLTELLNNDPFDAAVFLKQLDGSNEQTENTKGFRPPSLTIETIRSKHGELRVYYFEGSKTVKFGFSHLK